MFCRYCGSPIPEGGVCNCPEAVAARTPQTPPAPEKRAPVFPSASAPVSEAASASSPVPTATKAPAATLTIDANSVFGKLLSAVKALWTDMCGKDNGYITSSVFTGTGLLLHILSWVCLACAFTGSIHYSPKGVYGIAALCGFFTYGLSFGLCLLIPLFSQLLKKEGVQFKLCYANASAVAVVPAALFLIAGIMFIISSVLGMFFLVIALMVGALNCARLVFDHVGKERTMVSILITAVALALIAVIVGAVVYLVLNLYSKSFSNNTWMYIFASLLS